MQNLWHGVASGTPQNLNVIIEIPKLSRIKYELDKETGLIKFDRVLYSPMHYPANYGFVPQTLWDDGDPLDVVLLTTFPLHPGILVAVRPVAGIDMIDSGDGDYKVIAVPVDDKRWDDVNDLTDLNKHSLKEFQHFFETYKALKGKPAPVEIRVIDDKAKALAAIDRSMKLYQEKFGK